MVEGLPLRTLAYGLQPAARVRPLEHVSTLDGIRMAVETPGGRLDVASPLIGEHNVMNLLDACAVGVALRMEPAAIGSALATVTAVPGRFERVEAGQQFLVVVDYAHTPDALERVLATARRLTRGRLGVVSAAAATGTGEAPDHGRDRRAAGRPVWVTSTTGRSEDPLAIINEVVAGVGAAWSDLERCAMIPDRRAAIRAALDWARSGDLLVIAGKGHETYQIIGRDVFPFDDRAVVRQILAERVP
jgi:UDP-N-acetylmuramoyl-L-alanyl-D-glutamate--2,6-diaminopimelate ligase